MSLKRLEISLLTGMIAASVLSAFGAFAQECGEVREQVLRFHILANSDSAEDQALKLRVRDAVLNGTSALTQSAGGKTELTQAAAENLEEIEKIARAEIKAAGYDYEVYAQIADMYFETRTYDGITLPAGRYDAVRLSIGAGKGSNWWCVMFPPMCIPAASDGQSLSLTEQIARLTAQPRYVPKFAVVELLERLKETTDSKKNRHDPKGDDSSANHLSALNLG